MNNNLFKAILAMDSYNRGHGQGIVISGSKIGNAIIYDTKGDVVAQAAGFYGVAYQVAGGETIISYRGQMIK